MRYKALIIGCGNIGALYDMDNNQILTHTKAYKINGHFDIILYDTQLGILQKVANHYQLNYMTDFEKIDLYRFQFVSICTPSSTHFFYLKKCLEANVPIIICEKPISLSKDELNDLKILREKSTSKVIVNYMRRFHPTYQKVKDFFELYKGSFNQIQLTYQRGLINNASHAFDLINFLLGSIKLKDYQIQQSINDEFENDPTISLTARLDNTFLNVLGLSFVKFSFFEIKFFSSKFMVYFRNGGRQIEIFEAEQKKDANYYQPLANKIFSEENAMQDYMKYVIEHAIKLYLNEVKNDNFAEAWEINSLLISMVQNDGKISN